jgi:hypothetical protein
MLLRIVAIRDGGDLENERIILQATARCNLGKYILLTPKAGKIFFFSEHIVSCGDYVRVYTKAGTARIANAKQGSEQNRTRCHHLFYRGCDQPLWNDADDEAVLISVSDHQTFAVPYPTASNIPDAFDTTSVDAEALCVAAAGV